MDEEIKSVLMEIVKNNGELVEGNSNDGYCNCCGVSFWFNDNADHSSDCVVTRAKKLLESA